MNEQQSIEFAKKYLEDLLSFFGVNLEVTAEKNEEYIELSVASSEINSILIGRNAETLRAIQYLVTTTMRNSEASLTHVNVDIADYKRQRADKVAGQAKEWIEEVRESGNSKILNLNAADRRVVHRVAAEYSDIRTFSEGEGRERTLTIAQASS